jgi:hypothetical protein
LVSTTSGLTAFSIDIDDLLESALEPLGGEHTSGEEAKKARRTLNLLLIEMQNKNIPLSKIDFENVPLLATVAAYALNPNVLNVLEATIQDTTAPTNPDIKITGKSIAEYHVIPNKLQQNRPNTYMTQRLDTGVVVTVWPVPPTSTYTLKMMVSRKIEDVTAAYQKLNLPSRYLPLVTAWLSYKLSMTRIGITEEVKNRLQAEYTSMLPDTVEEDNEKVDYRVVPGGISGR